MGCDNSKPETNKPTTENSPVKNLKTNAAAPPKAITTPKAKAPEPSKMEKNGQSARIATREQQLHLHAKANRAAVRGRIMDFDEKFTPPKYPKTEADTKFLDKALGENFIFSDLSQEERKLLIDAMQKEEAKEGDIIIKQGDVGDFFYICEVGTINFVANGEAVGSCGTGGSFGELSLLYDSPRAATCIAGADCVLWKVDQGTFRHLLASSAQQGESSIVDVLAKIDLFKDLEKQTLKKFADVLTTVKFSEGERIVEKGQQGDIFYIINDGQVRVHDIGLGDATYADQILNKGDWFGERALMTGEPRAANATAMTEVVTFACDRETFESTIGSLEAILGQASKKRFIQSVPIFSKSELLPIEYDHLVAMLQVRKYEKGLKLAEAGKVGVNPSLWIVKEGKLMITDKEGNIFFLGSGDYFGDKAVQAEGEYISNETCIVEDDAVCWRLKKSDIEAVIGDIHRLGKPRPFTPKHFDTSITSKDVKKLKMLGMGAFGKVWLATTRDSTKPYALKTINKRQLVDAGQVKGVLREKQIMASIEHPFILPLVGSFQDEDNLYLLLPLIQGGELFNVIHTDIKDGLDNAASQFYGACILEALGYLHARNICYRDMKPENALIDADGYCIMVDFGFAKIVVDKTYTLCGTPEYLAPEIIMSKGHDKAVDYWSFGVLLYEMLVGQSPFYLYGTDQVSLFKRIVMVKYSCPSFVSDDAKDIIKKLLTRRQASRLGNLSRGYLDVKEHPWFQTLDFAKLNAKTLKTPWKPELSNPLDARNFDDFSRAEKETFRGRPLSPKEQNEFAGF